MAHSFSRKASTAILLLFALGQRPARSAETEDGQLTQEGHANPATTGAVASIPEPTGDLTLRQALAAALLRNPTLQGFGREFRAREALVVQAGLLPNPTLDGELEDFGGTGVRRTLNTAQATLSLAQVIQTGGKRARRKRVASFERELAGWDYEARRLDVAADVKKAFVAVIAAEDRVRLAEELNRVAAESLQAVKTAVRAGAVSPVEESRAAVALAQAETERGRLEREVAAARIALASFWGSSTPAFQRAVGDISQLTEPPPTETLIARVASNPDLARWRSEVAQRRAQLGLEHAGRLPDVAVSGGVRHYNDADDNAFVVNLSVPLPVFNRNQGAVVAATERLARAQTDQRAAEIAVRSLLAADAERLRATHQQVIAYRNTIVPKAAAAFAGARDAYRKGLFRYLEVLDAQRTLFQARSQYLDALVAYHSTVADIERFTGTPIEGDGEE